MDRDQVLGMLRRAPFTAGNPGTQRWRFRGAALAVTWLGDQPGSTWQQRWLASGAETAGADWKREGARWLDDHGVHVLKRLDLLSVGLVLAASADIIRPSLSWLAVSGISPWALARTLEARPRPGRVRPAAGRRRRGRPDHRPGAGCHHRPGGGPHRGQGRHARRRDRRRLPGTARRRAAGPRPAP